MRYENLSLSQELYFIYLFIYCCYYRNVFSLHLIFQLIFRVQRFFQFPSHSLVTCYITEFSGFQVTWVKEYNHIIFKYNVFWWKKIWKGHDHWQTSKLIPRTEGFTPIFVLGMYSRPPFQQWELFEDIALRWLSLEGMRCC